MKLLMSSAVSVCSTRVTSRWSQLALRHGVVEVSGEYHVTEVWTEEGVRSRCLRVVISLHA